MPIYEYRHLKKTGSCRERFEIIELARKEPLKVCPDCGQPVEMVPSIFTGKTNILSPANLKEKGFTKMVRDREKGGYRKVD
ncbi:MAG: zinc ribbon domain-containing protein [Nitrospinae bacterium]|nr:zinc ribbon domain-containing protein [Nitrospinota bacterium]